MARTIARDHDDKRQAILAAASRTFAAEGVAGSSMSRIAEAAGISKANIYHYWPSKEALLFDLLDRYLSDLAARVSALVPDPSPRRALLTLTSEILLAYHGMDDLHRIQTEGLATLPDDAQSTLKGHQRVLVSRMEDVLRAAAPAAFDDDRRRLRDTAMSVFGMLNWFYMWNARAGEAARRDYARLVTDLTLNGVRSRPTQTS